MELKSKDSTPEVRNSDAGDKGKSISAVKADSSKAEAKRSKKKVYATIRVDGDTKKRFQTICSNINKKRDGRTVKESDLLRVMSSSYRGEFDAQLAEKSLTSRDRFERKFRDHCDQFGAISRDEFQLLLLEKFASSKGDGE